MDFDGQRSYLPMALLLGTTRLVLQPFEAEDAEFYARLIADRGPGGRHHGLTVDGAREHIARLADESRSAGIGFLAIRRRHEADVIGYCGLLVGRATIDEPEIAYELIREAHGRGYATEAAVAVISAAAATGRHRLWATVGGWNTASFRVLEKTGFRRDHHEPDERNGEIVYLVRDL